jgi:hypothetical protein
MPVTTTVLPENLMSGSPVPISGQTRRGYGGSGADDVHWEALTFERLPGTLHGAHLIASHPFDALRAHRLLRLPGVGQDAARLQARQPVDFDCQGTGAFWCRELNADVEPSQRATSG